MSLVSQIRYAKALDSAATDGSGKISLAFGDFTAKYLVEGGTLTSLTTETITTLGTYQAPTSAAHIRIKELASTDPTKGIYEVHFHDTQVAVSGKKLWLFLSATGAAIQPLELDLITTAALPSAAAGASGGLLIAGSNAATTFASLTVTGAFLVSGGATYTNAGGTGFTCSSTGGNGSGVYYQGQGSGSGSLIVAGATGVGESITGGSSSGHAVVYNTVAGDAIHLTPAGGHAIFAQGLGSGKYGFYMTGPGGGFYAAGTSNSHGGTFAGQGTGNGLYSTSGAGATGDGAVFVAASTNGNGLTLTHAGSGKDLNATTTPLTLAKTTNLTGFNDIAATDVVSGGAITTSGGAVASVTTTINLTNAPTSGDLTSTMKTSVTTAATAATPTAAGVTAGVTLTSAYDFAKGTVAVTESYNADGAAPTPVQALLGIMQILMEMSIAGTTTTVKKLDGSTTAMTLTLTLDGSGNPTAVTRTT